MVAVWVELTVAFIVGLLAAAAALGSWAERRHREEVARRAAAEAQAARVPNLERKVEDLEAQLAELRARAAALEAQLDQERRAAEEKIRLLEQAKETLSDTFRGLSAEALRHNNEAFLQLARESLEKLQQAARVDLDHRHRAVEQLVQPLQNELDRLRTYLGEIEKQRAESYGAITQQLRELAESHLPRLHTETSNLVKALRQPAGRGRWGELQLRRVVEMAGMLPHCDFVEQVASDTEDGRLRPDLIVQLPGGRRLVVDAKAPVDAYLSAVEASDDEGRRRYLLQHASQVRAHMSNLGKKSYFEQFDVTPDFVVMFIPGEAFFSAALEVDPSLIEFGLQQRVIPASPTILIALLKAVAYGWRQEALAENAHRVAELGKELYKRIADLADHWAKVGQQLGSAVEAYNKSVATLERRVLVSARRFEALRAVPDGEAVPELRPIEAGPRPLTAPELTGRSGTAQPLGKVEGSE